MVVLKVVEELKVVELVVEIVPKVLGGCARRLCSEVVLGGCAEGGGRCAKGSWRLY